MSENKPTTADMAVAFSFHYIEGADVGEMAKLFDEWLAEVERAAAEKALIEAAKRLDVSTSGESDYWRGHADGRELAQRHLRGTGAALGLTAGQEGKNDE